MKPKYRNIEEIFVITRVRWIKAKTREKWTGSHILALRKDLIARIRCTMFNKKKIESGWHTQFENIRLPSAISCQSDYPELTD